MAGCPQQLAAALAFKRERLLAAAEVAEPVGAIPGAVLLRSPGLPRVWELNLIVAPAAAAARSAAELIAVCDEVERDHGFTHRKLRLDGAADRTAFARTAVAAGWNIDREIVMVRRRAPDRPSAPDGVIELERPALDRSADAFLTLEPLGRDPETRRQLVAQFDRWEHAAPRTLRLGVVEAGRVVAWCRVYDDGAVAEIDDVSVLHAHRGAGLGRRVMEGAITAVPPDRLLFLLADPDDWPRRLYERLGFDAVGERIGATRERA